MSVLKVIELLASSTVGKMQHKAITKASKLKNVKSVYVKNAAVSDGKISDTELPSWNSSK
jgi:hypothetical protein